MELKSTIRVAFSLYVVGLILFFSIKGLESGLWFALGGGLAVVNVFFASLVVERGLVGLRKSAFFLGLLLLKTLSFLVAITVVLMFLKPLLLPFTLGIGLVIVGAVGAAVLETRRLLRR